MNLEERFWSKVNIGGEDDRWNWIAGGRGGGYGAFNYNGEIIDSHRVAWALSHEEGIPTLWVCHTCDNRLCCNPKHLFLGTRQDNINDMISKNRQAKGDNQGTHTHPENIARGESNGQNKLKEEDVKNILNLYYNKKIAPIKIINKYNNVSKRTVWDIIEGRTWKHVFDRMFPFE